MKVLMSREATRTEIENLIIGQVNKLELTNLMKRKREWEGEGREQGYVTYV